MSTAMWSTTFWRKTGPETVMGKRFDVNWMSSIGKVAAFLAKRGAMLLGLDQRGPSAFI